MREAYKEKNREREREANRDIERGGERKEYKKQVATLLKQLCNNYITSSYTIFCRHIILCVH